MDKSKPMRVEFSIKGIIAILVILASAWLLINLKSIATLIFGSYIAFAALNPIVWNLEQKKFRGKNISRSLAIFVVFFIFLIVLGLAFWAIIGPTYTEGLKLAQNFDTLIEDAIQRYKLREILGDDRLLELQDQAINQISEISQQFSQNPEQIIDIGRNIAGGILSLVTFVAITFYQLVNPSKIRNFITSFFHDYQKGEKLLTKIEQKLGAWLQGQVSLMAIMGLSSYITFLLIGIPFALPLAIIVALFDIVAIVGPLIAYIPVLIVSLALADPWQVIAVTIVYLLLQQFEGNVLVPKIMQSSVGLDPILVIVALMMGGSLMGITGAILSVPVAAIIMIIYQQWQESKKNSKLETKISVSK